MRLISKTYGRPNISLCVCVPVRMCIVCDIVEVEGVRVRECLCVSSAPPCTPGHYPYNYGHGYPHPPYQYGPMPPHAPVPPV